MIINMMSDTVTKPTEEMLQTMINAEVGDDVFGEDPTVNALELKVANLFGKEAAIFCPSGTMTNQIAIKTHTQALDEMICDKDSHVYKYETGGYAFNAGVSVSLIDGSYGKITAEQIEEKIHPDFDWLPKSKLVVLENSCNKGGGSVYKTNEIEPIRNLTIKNKLKLHLDGARIFNALEASKESTIQMGKLFDSISICLSKGLGAPVGSCLIGTKTFIKQARRYRKVMGGGMRQAGYLAAAGIFALDHNIHRLKIDHDRAKILGTIMEAKSFIESVNPVSTNIVILNLSPNLLADKFLTTLRQKGILAVPFGKYSVRFITHLGITDDMFDRLISILNELSIDDFLN